MTPDRNTLSPDDAVAAARFERPLTARSVMASLLLRTDPPRMPGRRLVQWCGLFGIPEGTARVALSRMAERGELRADDGVYELAGRVGGRRAAQDFSLHPEPVPWHGSWLLAVVAPGARSAVERQALRDAARRTRMAELREGVWTRPDNLPRAAAPDDAWSVVDAQCEQWDGAPAEDPVDVAARCFDPSAWAARALELLGPLRTVTESLANDDEAALADAFVVGASALAHVRADPLLPAELCPSPWPGDDLRAGYLAYERAFTRTVRAWFAKH